MNPKIDSMVDLAARPIRVADASSAAPRRTEWRERDAGCPWQVPSLILLP
jgi:hypothetical protein